MEDLSVVLNNSGIGGYFTCARTNLIWFAKHKTLLLSLKTVFKIQNLLSVPAQHAFIEVIEHW